jgi:hypothetical protein
MTISPKVMQAGRNQAIKKSYSHCLKLRLGLGGGLALHSISPLPHILLNDIAVLQKHLNLSHQ